ncbi:MAG TPA: hypothetical protein VMX37_06770 [Acidimicrobiia bacterium]|nr:hypothetical protein [Acidimicrobiia bacterium]
MNAWRGWGRYVVAAVVSATIGWVAFGAGRPVPILDQFDLGVHEAGHLLTGPLPDLVMFLAGSAAQVAVPLALGAYFLWGRKEWASAGFCTAWAATSVRDVGVYIADAPRQALPLVGGGTHDWAWLLGPHEFNCLDQAGAIARGVEVGGLVLAVAGVALCLWPLADGVRLPRRRGSAALVSMGRRLPSGGVDPSGDPWLAAASSGWRDDGR